MPRLTVFAGINGAGKTTLYNYLSKKDTLSLGKRVCPDEILQNFKGDWRDSGDQFKSGKIAILEIRENIAKQHSFNWELTLLTTALLSYLKKAKEQGFVVNVNFIGVEDLQQSLDRIKNRVDKGGHDVEKELVEMRYKRQFENFSEVFEVVDGILFYDNAETMRLIGGYIDKTLFMTDTRPKWAEKIIYQYDCFAREYQEMRQGKEIVVDEKATKFDKPVKFELGSMYEYGELTFVENTDREKK